MSEDRTGEQRPGIAYVPLRELDEMERRTLWVNRQLLNAARFLREGNEDAALSVVQLVQEQNWTVRKALIEAGAADSIAPTRRPETEKWDEDEAPVIAADLDLNQLRQEFAPE